MNSMRGAHGVPELSVVVLCYQAGDVARVYAGKIRAVLEHEAPDHEIILVANYWPDRNDLTPAIVADIAKNDARVRIVSLPKHGGMGEDARAGLAAARGRFIAFIDGDLQMPAKDVIRVYHHLKERGLDLCLTWRVKRMDGAGRKAVSLAYNLLFRICFPGLDVSDVNSKPKILTRKALDRLDLRSDDWFIDAEIMIQARRFKFLVDEVPTTFLKNEARSSFIRWTTNLEFLKNLIAARWREFFLPPSRGSGPL